MATVERAAATAERLTRASRRAARQATVPTPTAQRRGRPFLWAALIALAAFALLVGLVHGHRQNPVDRAITLRIQRQQRRWPWLGRLMHWVSLPGFAPWSWLIPIGTAGGLRWLNYRLESRLLLGTSLANLLVALLKRLMARPRPADPQIAVQRQLRDYSFPSAHTVQYVVQFGFATYLAYALLRPGRLRQLLVAAGGLLIVLIGPSRVAMGHHWASDVLASYCLGTALLIGAVTLYRRLKGQRWRERRAAARRAVARRA